MQYIPWRVAIPIVLTGASLEAQFQDRVYPIPELTDEMRGRIDLNDGSVEDWLEVLGEPTLTPLDFFTLPLGSEYDPSSLGPSMIHPRSTSASGWPGTMAEITFS